MLSTVQELLLNQELSRHFVSEMLSFYLVVMLSAAAALLIIGIYEKIDNMY